MSRGFRVEAVANSIKMGFCAGCSVVRRIGSIEECMLLQGAAKRMNLLHGNLSAR
jgi:hypothetical protein